MALSTIGKKESIKLDLYDKKIFWELSINSRISRKQLAKKLKISQERLHYKINRLIKELFEPAILLNYSLLGISQYKILVKKLDKEIIDNLSKEASVFALLHNIGEYPYLLYVVTKNINSFCKEFLPDSQLEIFPIIRGIPDNWNPFNLNTRPEPIRENKKITLDKKDYKILYELSKNPLEPIIQISEKTKIDRKTIQSRIKKMLDSNVIQKFRLASNIFKIGFSSYFLKINVTPKNKEKILSAIRADNYSGFVYETYTGFFMYYLSPSHYELFRFTKKLEEIDKTIQLDVMLNTDVIKIEPVPKKILEIFKERFQ